ncbi:MAG TPA: lamin tail domain-containing protein, partial [Planctomycetota bacterium]|nr:lamin tail domain-containing protein [Planctomycetota bacterium]
MRLQRSGRLLSLAVFSAALLPQSLDAMKITELLYNPGAASGAGDTLEFVELHNDSPGPVDLSGAYFSKGIDFVFPEGTFLHARGYIAVAAGADALRSRFPEANVIGDFSGRLDNGGESIALVTRTGSPLAEVTYKNRNRWPVTPNGTGYSLALRSPFLDPNDPGSWTRSAAPLGTPGVENFAPPYTADNEVFPEAGPEGAWKYRKGWNETTLAKEDFSVPPGAWRAPGFDDSSWIEAPVPIGFNEPEIVTILADMAGNYDSFAVRKRFTITAAQMGELTGVTLLVRVDDGCVVYLNGEELGRMGLAGDPGTDVPFDATATSARELRTTKPLAFVAQKERVHEGENVLAIQVHNRPTTTASNDAGFAASLTYQTTVVPAPLPETSIVFNEVVSRAAPHLRAVELFNTRDAAMDIGSFVLTDAPFGGRTYTIPPGTVLPAGGFLSIPEGTLGFSFARLELSLFLFEPDGLSIVDAVTVEDPLVLPAESQSHARFPDGEGDWWVSTAPTPGAPNQVIVEKDLVINEIHFNPKLTAPGGEALPDQEQGEFIEIFNRSNRTISLDGSRLVSGFNYAFAPGTTLGPGAYIVVARSPKFIRETYGLAPGEVVGLSETASKEESDQFGVLRNRGERVRLVDSLGNTLDEVRYSADGEWEALADAGGSTLELIDPRQDNNAPSAWGASDESQRAPWTEISFDARYATNLVPQPMESELHIYFLAAGECLIDGVSITAGDPPVEHISNGDFEVDTRPWRITGTHVQSQRTTEEAKVGTASLHVVATGGGDNRVNRIELDTTPALRAGDIHFKMWARWLRGANTLHVCGHNNAFGTTIRLPMPLGAGSPGRENGLTARLRAETGSANLGPVISNVRHEPAVPGNLEPIRIRATVSDSDGVA